MTLFIKIQFVPQREHNLHFLDKTNGKYYIAHACLFIAIITHTVQPHNVEEPTVTSRLYRVQPVPDTSSTSCYLRYKE